MTQVSKRQLGRQMEELVYGTFWETAARLNKKEEVDLFFTDLFTTAERVNFIKRLSIAVLLNKGYDWRQICDLLKVSPNTIAKVSGRLNGSGFRLFFEKVEREKNWGQFWKDLAKIYLLATHPEKYGRLGDEGVEAIYFKQKNKTLL